VRCDGEHIFDQDKLVCRERTIVSRIDTTELLREYARLCAMSVVHLWDAPSVVKEYLKTGNESIRKAARDAAWAAREVARDAARSAVWAAWAAARDAARDAAWAARAARDAAGDAAWAAWAARDAARAVRATRDARDAAKAKQNRMFDTLVTKAFKEGAHK
jgi:hypothetical protein